jgi:hypothetical protein
MEELKSRLEILLGAKPEAAVDESQKQDSEEIAKMLSVAHRQRVAEAGGELLGAAFRFLGEIAGQKDAPLPSAVMVANLRAGLDACVQQDADGKPQLTITLPDSNALDGLAQALAKLLGLGNAENASAG